MPARESFRSSTPPDSKCSTSAVVAQLRKIAARALPKLRVSAAAATIRVSRGALAQLVRAPPCHGGGCGFEPRRLRSLTKWNGPNSRQIRDKFRGHGIRKRKKPRCVPSGPRSAEFIKKLAAYGSEGSRFESPR